MSNVSTGQITASNNTTTVITFDTEAYDTDNFHSTSSNTSRMTIPAGKSGKYLCTGKFRWFTNTSGVRFMNFSVNGTDVDGTNILPNANNPFQTHTAVLSLSVGDYVELTAYQTSGSNQDVALNQGQSKFTISYLGA